MKAYKKGDYVIRARWAYPDEEIYNYLEQSYYITDEDRCIVLIGTADEEWPITLERLVETYRYANDDGTDAGEILKEDLGDIFIQCTKDDPQWMAIHPVQSANAPIVYAEPTDVNDVFEVIAYGDTPLTANAPDVPHGDGDWIVYGDAGGSPDENNCWIVNGLVFKNTYKEAKKSE